ncbi:MAG: thiol peroxidase [Muribaculaceae bacterium]|nr:thiol peroxidase [Muribaculaceae bacterium]MBQ7853457.1 thiol peroxidase [Muribaculaceae bacterium]MBR3829896.1 thiol peroxidase [Muribaculaceae bacterium]
METIKFKGEECHTMGVFPKVGDKARYFLLTTSGLNDVELCDYKGRCVVLNIFPSLDTDVCAMSVRRFNEMASLLDDVVVLCVSMDLPFAAKRFCVAQGIDNVEVVSAFRSPLFGRKYGVELIDGPLAGLLARGVVVIGENNRVIYSQLVDEITNEPDYEECYEALRLYQSVNE